MNYAKRYTVQVTLDDDEILDLRVAAASQGLSVASFVTALVRKRLRAVAA